MYSLSIQIIKGKKLLTLILITKVVAASAVKNVKFADFCQFFVELVAAIIWVGD